MPKESLARSLEMGIPENSVRTTRGMKLSEMSLESSKDFADGDSTQEKNLSLSFLRYIRFMIASIEGVEVSHDAEYPKFKLLPVLPEGRKFVTLDNQDNRGVRFLATNAKSRQNSKEQNAIIDSKFESLECFF